MKKIPASITAIPWHYFVLGAITLLALGLRINNLDAKSLWVDEIGQVLASRDGFLAALRGASRHFGAAPLDYQITYLTVRTLGQGDAVVRLPAVLWGTVAIGLIYWLGVSIFASRLVGLLSAFLLALNPAHIQYSQEARWYSLSTMLALLSVNLVLLAVRKRHPFYWVVVSVSLLLSVATTIHHALLTMAIFLSLFLIWLLTRRSAEPEADAPRRNDLIQFVAAATPAALFVIYWYLSGSLRSEVGNSFSFDPPTWQQLIVWPVFGYYGTPARSWYYPLSTIGPIVFPILAILGLIASFLHRKRFAIILFAMILLCGVGIYAIDATFDYFWAYRQFTFLVPFYLLFVAYALVTLGKLIQQPQWLGDVVAIAFVAVLVWFTVPEITNYYNYPKANWRGTAQMLYQAAGDPRAEIYVTDDSHRFLTFYQPALKGQLLSPNALDTAAAPKVTNARIWFSGPADKLSELQEAGWIAVNLNTGMVGSGMQFYYLGQNEAAVLFLELAEMALPPEVLVNGFLYQIRKIDPQLAINLGSAVVDGAADFYFPMTARVKADLGAILGRVYFDTGQQDKGLSLAKWAVDNDSTSLEALSNIGYFYVSMNNPSAAKEPLERCTILYPRFYWCHNFITNVYSAEGEWEKAAEAHFLAYQNGTSDRKEPHLTAAIEAYKKAELPEKAQELQTLLDQQ